MRIVVWNCGMRLRGQKLRALENLQPDIAVVPACECPEKLWGKQPLLAPIPMEWIGENENHGLGVLAFNGYRLQRHGDYDPSLRWLLPVEIRGPVNFSLLAVSAASPLPGAIKYFQAFLKAGPAIVAGDFRSNVVEPAVAKSDSHARTIAALERLGMASAYHVGRGELHGKESAATWHADKRKATDKSSHHADYCFLPADWCSHLREVELGAPTTWVGKGLSDHVPLIVDVDLPTRRGQAAMRRKSVRSDL